MVKLSRLRHTYPEPEGACLNRPYGHEEYTFLHFFNSVELLCDGKIVKTPPHSLIIYRPKTPQYFKTLSPMVHDFIHFTWDSERLFEENGFEPDKIYSLAHAEFVTDLISEMESEFYAEGQDNERLIGLKFEELFIKLGRAISGKSVMDIKKETREKFRKLRGQIFTHLNEEWSLSKMASEICYSESQFSALYKSIYGISPINDLINAKIDSAVSMLVFDNLRIEEISNLLGYKNITHFIRQFKAKTGLSPSEYRKKHKLN